MPDPLENPVFLPIRIEFGREVSVENGGGGGGGGRQRWGVRHGVGEIGADLGDVVGGDGEAVEDGGDEGGGAAEGLSHDDAVSYKNVVAVVSDHQATASRRRRARFSLIPQHEMGRE